MRKKMLLLTGGLLRTPSAKTALNLIRYQPENVVAVWDAPHAGQSCQAAIGFGGAIPIVGSWDRAPAGDTLVIGIAPPGGQLPAEMRVIVREALRRGMHVLSGLHDFLGDDPDLAEVARQHGVTIEDIRKNTERDVAHRLNLDERCLRILTVGHDCNVGKMVVSLELSRALERAGQDAVFVATGQTGILIAGSGCPVDAVVSDFLNGAVEKLVLANQHHAIQLIEGQGSIVHPRYSPVTLGLLHGSVPDGLILCYEMGRETVYGMDKVRLPSLATFVRLYEALANVMHPCRVLGVAMNSRNFSDEAAAREREQVRRELNLPVCDVIRHGPGELVEAVLRRKQEAGK